MRKSYGRRGARGVVTAALIALNGAFGSGAVQAQPSSAPAKPSAASTEDKPAQIDRNGVLMLIRSTLLAVDHANRTGNYTVLRDLGAPGFQGANTATKLGEIFASLRSQNLDLSGVAVLDPQLTVLPTVGANGMMRMAGFFPSVPVQINFELLYAPVEGRWRLFGIGLGLGQSSPAAPSDPAPSPAAEAKPASKPPNGKPAGPSQAKPPR